MSDREREEARDRSIMGVLREESRGFHPRLRWMHLRNALLPRNAGTLQRAQLLRDAGFEIGADTIVRGMPRITGSAVGSHPDAGDGLFAHLRIGVSCILSIGVVFDLEERITIGNNVVVGPQVMILTSTHELGPREHRAGPLVRNPVVIGNGAWIGARCVILPGVTIGAGSVVDAGSVVNKDVPPDARFGGIPAKKLEIFADPE